MQRHNLVSAISDWRACWGSTTVQVQHDTAYPPNDAVHQFKYIGAALSDST